MYPTIFYTLFTPNKSKTALNQLIKRRFPYPEPNYLIYF